MTNDDQALTVPTNELRVLLDRLLSHLEAEGIHHIEVKSDYYWHVPREEWTNPYHEPTELTMGSIEEDWEFLESMKASDAYWHSVSVGVYLGKLAAVVRAVGDEIATPRT